MNIIDKSSSKDFENIEYLKKEELDKLSFIELCVYLETLNKIKQKQENC